MSTIKVDTLVAADGSSPVALTKQYAAKAWSNLDQRATLNVRDSFNLSSQTDVEGGNIALSLTNNMTDGYYVVTGLSQYIDSTENGLVPAMGLRRGAVKTSSGYETQTATAVWSSNDGTDVDSVMTSVDGDLA
jgi:hypothetical protein